MQHPISTTPNRFQHSSPPETIVFLHGLARTRHSFHRIQKYLAKTGASCRSINYASMRQSIEDSSKQIERNLLHESFWSQDHRVSFVTHSLGGLVLLAYLERQLKNIPPGKLHRVVMLGPPLGGSEIADFWNPFPPYHWIFGPVGQELTTSHRDKILIKTTINLGIIAGSNHGYYPDSPFIFKEPHDGRVSITRTKTSQMADHIILPVSHSGLLVSRAVCQQTRFFLDHGTFNHTAS